MDMAAFMLLARSCAPAIDIRTARALVAIESHYNPYAIGVVGGVLERQPATRAEAVATVKQLQRDGWNYSVGLAQINKTNFDRYALDEASAFEPCNNLKAMQGILSDCYRRALTQSSEEQHALRRALSCYYSGNFQTGFDHGYVQKIERVAARLSR